MDPIRRSLVVVAALVAPAMTLAQTPIRPADSQEPIPRELAVALLNLGPGMGGGADILIGKAPQDIPPELLPPGFQILGSTTQFENAVIVLAAPQAPDSAISVFEAHLLASGWSKPPVPVSRPQRGFVSADFGQYNAGQPDMVCKDDAFAMMSGTYRRSGGSVIKVSYNRGQRFSACKSREVTIGYRSPYDDAPVPTLRAPQGSMPPNEASGGSSMTTVGGAGMNSFGFSTRLRTRLKAAEVVAHYDKQMREQGWTPLTDGAAEILAARTYKKNDEKSRPWTAMLMSMTIPETTDQDVSLKLNRK